MVRLFIYGIIARILPINFYSTFNSYDQMESDISSESEDVSDGNISGIEVLEWSDDDKVDLTNSSSFSFMDNSV